MDAGELADGLATVLRGSNREQAEIAMVYAGFKSDLWDREVATLAKALGGLSSDIRSRAMFAAGFVKAVYLT